MIVLVVLHLLRVFFYGAYKYPREATWITGVLLLLVVVGFGFTGTCCPGIRKPTGRQPWEPHSGVAPVIGDWILRIARGGLSFPRLRWRASSARMSGSCRLRLVPLSSLTCIW